MNLARSFRIIVPLLGASPALAQSTLMFEDFEDAPDFSGWLCNGNTETQPGNPGTAIGVPLLDFWGITLRNEDPAQPILGDLTRHPNLTITFDVRVFRLFNFFGEPMDPGNFPIVLEFVDSDPNGGIPVSVYTVGSGMPAVEDGWSTRTYTVDTQSVNLPAGWGGTGDEDPQTFEPRLPVGRTYQSVLQNVDEVRITTFVPGFFYAAAFWEVGFDNVHVQAGSARCIADVDDGSGSGTPDGGVTIDDLLYYLGIFEAGAMAADVDNGTSTGTPDGGVTIDDLLYYLIRFEGGC